MLGSYTKRRQSKDAAGACGRDMVDTCRCNRARMALRRSATRLACIPTLHSVLEIWWNQPLPTFSWWWCGFSVVRTTFLPTASFATSTTTLRNDFATNAAPQESIRNSYQIEGRALRKATKHLSIIVIKHSQNEDETFLHFG